MSANDIVIIIISETIMDISVIAFDSYPPSFDNICFNLSVIGPIPFAILIINCVLVVSGNGDTGFY